VKQLRIIKRESLSRLARLGPAAALHKPAPGCPYTFGQMTPETPQSDLDLLPEELSSQSRSDCEIVLPYQAALEAIAHLRASGVGFLGWEGWVQKPDGHVGHIASFQGTVGLFRHEGESWGDFVNRTADYCVKTIILDQQRWNQSPNARTGDTLCFCITVDSERRG
jgi:hypothetical protein